MWTWTAIFALAFVVQGSLGVPTFGTGPQQEWWNEVDDEFPGEIRQFDDVTPLSDPDDNIDEQQSSHDKKRSTSSIIPISPTIEPLPAPTPTPRPPTVSEAPEEEYSNNSDSKDSFQLTSSIPAPLVPIMDAPAKEPLKYQQSPELLPAKGEVSRSGAGNLETNEVIKNPASFSPQEKYISTFSPISSPPLTPVSNGKEVERLGNAFKDDAKVVDSLSYRRKADTHQSTSIPLLAPSDSAQTPTPRPPTASDTAEEDSAKNFDPKERHQFTSSIPTSPVPRMGVPTKEILEYPKSLYLLPNQVEVPRSETGNLEIHEENKSPDHSSPPPKYIVTSIQNKYDESVIAPPLTLLRTAKEGEGFEEIFKDVAKVLDSLSSPSKEEMHQSKSVSPLPHLNNNVKTTDSNKEIFNILSRIQKELSIPPSFDDVRSYKSKEYDSKDDPYRGEYDRIKLYPQVHNAPPTKTIKGVLLKSLVPRQYFIIKDIYDILKARAIATSNNEEEEDIFKPDLLQGLRSDERYVAVAPERSPHTELPQLYFPNREQQFVESKLEPDPEIPDFDEFIKPNFSEDQLISRYREVLNQFINMYLNKQAIADPLENQDDSDEQNDSDSKMENLLSFLQNEFGGQVDSMVKDPEVPPALGRFLLKEEDPTKNFRLSSYR